MPTLAAYLRTFVVIDNDKISHLYCLTCFQEDVGHMPTLAAYLRTFVVPGTQERHEAEKRPSVSMRTPLVR